jgi:hypothetical protein
MAFANLSAVLIVLIDGALREVIQSTDEHIVYGALFGRLFPRLLQDRCIRE